MARVLGVHEIELKPGVDPDRFEKAASEVVTSAQPEGWRTLVLKGERGPRSGNYLIIFEIDGPEARDRLYPAEGQASAEESDRFDREHPQTAAAWERLSELIVHFEVATDYMVVAE